MQNAPAVMALGLAEVSYFAVGFIYEDEGFGVGGDCVCAAATLPNFIRHKDNSTRGEHVCEMLRRTVGCAMSIHPYMIAV